MNRFLQTLRHWVRNSQGSAAIEFAMVVLPTLYIIFATIEVGIKSLYQSELDTKLYELSVHLATQSDGSLTATEFRDNTFCPVIGTTILNCSKVELGAVKIVNRVLMKEAARLRGHGTLDARAIRSSSLKCYIL